MSREIDRGKAGAVGGGLSCHVIWFGTLAAVIIGARIPTLRRTGIPTAFSTVPKVRGTRHVLERGAGVLENVGLD